MAAVETLRWPAQDAKDVYVACVSGLQHLHSFLMAAPVQLPHFFITVAMCWHLDTLPRCCIGKSC